MKDKDWGYLFIVITLIISIAFFVALKDKVTISTNVYKEGKVVELRDSKCIRD